MSQHQLSGSITLGIELDRIADRLGDQIAARVIGALASWDMAAEGDADEPAGSDEYHRPDVPEPRLPADSDPGGYALGRHGHRLASMAEAALEGQRLAHYLDAGEPDESDPAPGQPGWWAEQPAEPEGGWCLVHPLNPAVGCPVCSGAAGGDAS